MECARRLIVDSSLGFDEAAGRVGFRSCRTLSYVFRRRRSDLEAGTRVRVFEDLVILCGRCARRHAPPAIAGVLASETLAAEADVGGEAETEGWAQVLRGVFGS